MGTDLVTQDTISALLDGQMPELAKALPNACGMDAERLARLCLTTFRKTPGLLKCSRDSILESVMHAAELGLEVGTPRGHAYLVPFRGECTLVEGYRGLAALAMRSGVVHYIEATIVYSGEKFSYERGLTPKLEHVPDLKHRDLKDATHVYAIARMKDGPDKWEVLDREYVDRIKQGALRKAGGSYTCWGDEEVEAQMWLKTAVRFVCKLLPDDTLPAALHQVWALQDQRMYESDAERLTRKTAASTPDLADALDGALNDTAAGRDARGEDAAGATEPETDPPHEPEPARTVDPEPERPAKPKPAPASTGGNAPPDFSGCNDSTLAAMAEGAKNTIKEARSFGAPDDDREIVDATRKLQAVEAEVAKRGK